MMLKPPSPASLGPKTSTPPPPSCSPFNGKSSWNTNTDSCAGGKGVGCANTVRGVVTPGTTVVPPGRQLVAGGVGVQGGGAVVPVYCSAVQVVVVVVPVVVVAQRTAAGIGTPPMP